jgi:hypothetical protein
MRTFARLELHRETLRELAGAEMEAVGGGWVPPSSTLYSCQCTALIQCLTRSVVQSCQQPTQYC